MMTLQQDEHEFAVAYFLYSAAIVRCRYDEMQIVGFSVAMYTTGFQYK